MRNMGAVYLGILAIHMGLQFFKKYLEQSFLILLTDTSKILLYYYYYNYFKL